MVLWINPNSSYHTFSMIGKWPKVDRSLIGSFSMFLVLIKWVWLWIACSIMQLAIMSHIVCAVYLGVRRGVFIFELSWKHSAALPRKIFLFPCWRRCSQVKSGVHIGNIMFTLFLLWQFFIITVNSILRYIAILIYLQYFNHSDFTPLIFYHYK